jgi:outer membrane protein TolC
MKKAILCIYILSSLVSYSQNYAKQFTYYEFMDIVKQYHPIVYQANLKVEKGAAYIRKARGGFDPEISGDINQKYFKNKNYYSHINTDLIIPTWFGLTMQAGYDDNYGDFLSNELTTPTEGLWHAGVTLNLGNGLFIDKRRAELNQAKIFNNSSVLEQRLILNQLILDASIAYFDWVKSYEKKQVYEEALANAEFRFQGIKQSAIFGDKPFIDTIKAKIQVQNRQIKLEQINLDLLNKIAQLEVFLWQDGFVPLELDTMVIPSEFIEVDISKGQFEKINLDSLIVNHPEIEIAQNNIDISKIYFRLKRESLKPVVQLKYNALSGTFNNNSVIDNYNINNYNWGAKVSYPLFTRKERGDLKLADIKVKDQQAKIKVKTTSLKYKIDAANNSWKSLIKQQDLYTETVKNYKSLLDGELKLFNIGESSLFLVNVRDQDLIDAQIKLVDIYYQELISEVVFGYHIFGL